MKTYIKSGQGLLSLPIPTSGFPALRLVKALTPSLRVECTDAQGASHSLPLSDIDISHATVTLLNTSVAAPRESGVFAVDPQKVAEIAALVR